MNKLCVISQSIIKLILLFIFIKQIFKSVIIKKKKNKKYIAIIIERLKDGGTERVMSILANELSKIKNFKVILLTGPVESEEFLIESNIKRLIVYNAYGRSFYLNHDSMKNIFRNFNIDIIIYNRIFLDQIQFLLALKKKLILIYHFQYLHFYYDVEKYLIYRDFDVFKYSNLMISLIPDDLFFWKKRGIKNIIYLPNLLPFNIKKIKQSPLTTKNILMVGRGDDACKQFNLGIKAMVEIIKVIPDAKLIIVSSLYHIEPLSKLREALHLEKYVDFVGYKPNPEIYYQNSSIFFLPSRDEGFPMVLFEAKAFGVPSIVTGKKYLTLIQEGTIKIEEDDLGGMINESIKLLSNYTFRLQEGVKARKSIEKFDNALTIKKWEKIINSIYDQENSLKKIVENENKIYNETKSMIIMKHEFDILTKKVKNYSCRKFEDLLNSLNKSILNFC